MNEPEAAKLLAHAAGFDNRQPSTAAAKSWAAALHDVPFDQDARDAVAAYYSTPPQKEGDRLWLLPHHVRTLRTKLRNKRLTGFMYEPVGDETIGEYLDRYRGQVAAIAAGHVESPRGTLALKGGPSREFVAELESRGWSGLRMITDGTEQTAPQQLGPLGVECPACQAAIGRPCKTPGSTRKQPLGKPRQTPHAARRDAAAGRSGLTATQRAAEEQRVRDASARALSRLDDAIEDAEIVEEAS